MVLTLHDVVSGSLSTSGPSTPWTSMGTIYELWTTNGFYIIQIWSIYDPHMKSIHLPIIFYIIYINYGPHGMVKVNASYYYVLLNSTLYGPNQDIPSIIWLIYDLYKATYDPFMLILCDQYMIYI